MKDIYDYIKVPSVNVILGKRGSGKSALAHSLLEKLSAKYGLMAGIVGFPEDKKHLIPNTYSVFNSFDFPKNCIIFIDEVSFFAHARKSMSTMNTTLDNLMARCRHMNWIIVVASHHSTKIDISLIRDADNIIFKEPSRLEAEYGSRVGVLTNMAKKARFRFKDLIGTKQQYSYLFNEDAEGMVTNGLASYWTDELSITTVQPINNNKATTTVNNISTVTGIVDNNIFSDCFKDLIINYVFSNAKKDENTINTMSTLVNTCNMMNASISGVKYLDLNALPVKVYSNDNNILLVSSKGVIWLFNKGLWRLLSYNNLKDIINR